MHAVSRRSLMKSSLTAIAVSPLLPLVSSSSAFATTYPTLSASAVSAAKSSLNNLNSKLAAGTATPSTIQSAATALSILFGNMHESGWNSAFVGPLRTAIQNLINSGADPAPQVRSLLAQNGISITAAQAEKYFHPTISQLQQWLADLTSPGLYAMEQDIATSLANAAKAAEASGVTHLSGSGSSQARLLRVIRPVGGCAADGLACGVISVFSPPPIDLIFGILGIIYGVMDGLDLC